MKKFGLILIFGILFQGVTFSQWVLQHTSSPNQTVMALKFYNNNTGYYSGVLYNSSTFNIYKTTNGGLNFISQNSYYTAQRFMSIWIIHPDTVLISGNYGKILKTVNGGNNWNLVYADTVKQFWSLFFVNHNTGFVSGSHGTIMKTTNKGDNWTILNSTSQTALDGMWFVNENTGYVGGANVFLKTTDGGQTWVNKVGNFISSFEIAEAVYFSDANTGYYCTNTSSARIVKTTNGGDTWSLVHSQEGYNAGWGMSFTNSMTGYVCTGSGKVLKTTNAGVNWSEQNTPLTENLYEIHFPSADTGYISSWSGKILKTTNGGVTFIGKINNEVPEKFILNQNYPNPFNPSTNISFSIPSRVFVKVQIFNIMGKLVSELVNEELAPGNYEVTYNANKISSGVYYYRLTAGDHSSSSGHGFSETKKMILIK
jgi:photosystem II stability/assembly factor-like uncharacterized protein